MKCDLHVHTTASGMCTVPLLSAVCRECYNDPAEVYETLKRRGMDLVTVTDHDSIDAAEPLRKHRDFFLSEELTCVTGSGTQFHMGVYGIAEPQHEQLLRRRGDIEALLAYLDEQRLLFSVNHVFSSLTGPRTGQDFALFGERFPAYETRNGQMLEAANRSAAALAAALGKVALGGSDAHTLAGLGRTYTEVPGAGDAAEFLAGLRSGMSRVHGESGNLAKLTLAVLAIGGEMMRERTWTLLLAPLMAAAPLVTLGNYLREIAFEKKWAAALAVCGRTAGVREALDEIAQIVS